MVRTKKEESELNDQKRESAIQNRNGGGAPQRVVMDCDSCGTVFALNALRVTKLNVPGEDYLRLTYFTCPGCGKIFRVSLNDRSTDQMRLKMNEDIEECLNYMRALDPNDNYGFNQLNGEIIEIRQRYEDVLGQLNDRYSGEFYLGNPRTGDDAACVNAEDDLWYRGPELG